MSDKVNAALVDLEKARTKALDVAVAERAYRLCALLDQDGPAQRTIDRARRLLNGRVKDKSAKK